MTPSALPFRSAFEGHLSNQINRVEMLVQARQAEAALKGGSLRLGISNCRSGGYEGKDEGLGVY